MVSIVGFIVTAVACYQGAIRGVPWLGMAVFVAVAALLLAGTAEQRGQRLVLVLSVAGIGFVLDTCLIATGVYSVTPSARWLLPAPLCPEWILALWANFGLVIYGYLAMMKGRHLPAVVIGIIFGLLIYSNAARAGLVTLRANGLPGLLIVALVWAVVVPAIYALARRVTATPPLTSPTPHQQGP